jgi:hypothetical protein
VPSDADSLIAYQQQLATPAPCHGFSTTPSSIVGACWVCLPVESPVRVLIMTQPGPGSDHVCWPGGLNGG